MDEKSVDLDVDVKRLRACVNDLVSVLALPAIWSGGQPHDIGVALIDALLGMLQLDFAYVQLKDLAGDAPEELSRSAGQRNVGAPSQRLAEAAHEVLRVAVHSSRQTMKNPSGPGTVSVAPFRLGFRDGAGWLVAGSMRASFPSTIEKLLLGVAGNQAAIGLQEARLRETYRHTAEELERRVAERTRELSILKEQVQRENVSLREEVEATSMFEEIVGTSPALKAVLARISKVAPTDSAVLITGETGAGKELIARAIHKRSARSARAFVNVNCAAIPPSLIASELFGHEKGAFTGAWQRRIGRFELAQGGTLFLDEVGEFPPETQLTLLRVLQEREFERLGGTGPVAADVRLIAATNRDLEEAIAAGTFRSDLFYRLNVFPIEVPSLRARKEDIRTLTEYFVHRYAKKLGKAISGISKRTLDLFESYPWPGNIRELQNVIERSMIVCETDIFAVDSSWLVRQPSKTGERARLPQKPTLADAKGVIEAALAASRGRVSGPSGAAVQLGVPASTLESKIRSLRINKHSFKAT